MQGFWGETVYGLVLPMHWAEPMITFRGVDCVDGDW
jgi:hypothetical protein